MNIFLYYLESTSSKKYLTFNLNTEFLKNFLGSLSGSQAYFYIYSCNFREFWCCLIDEVVITERKH